MKAGLRLAFSITIVTSILFLPVLRLGETAFQIPYISLDPVSGPEYTIVTVTAEDFDPSAYASIYWDGTDLGAGFSLNENGNGSGIFKVPSGASAGYHTVYVCTACGKAGSEKYAIQSFEVTTTSKPTETPTYPPKPIIPSDTPTYPPKPIIPSYTPTYPPKPGGPTDTPTEKPFVPSHTPTERPFVPSHTPTVTATATAGAIGIIPYIPYVPQSIPYMPRIGDHICTSLGLGSDAIRIGFDDTGSGTNLGNQYSSQGVQFMSGTALVSVPPMGSHSPGNAVRS